jgi:membrane protein DedA with SNARE-associated domain
MTNSTSKSSGSITQTYNTLKWTVVAGDTQWLQKAVNESSGTASVLLISGILMFVIISSIIETGTFFGVLLPSDLILSVSVIVFIWMKQWWLVALVTILSILFTIVWDNLWYMTGRKLWSTLYDKEDTRYFKKKYFLEAQESIIKNWDRMLYIGRYLSIGGFLPTIYGVMNIDRQRFMKLSAITATIWKLSLVIPMVILMIVFPSIQYRVGILLVLVFTLPEVIGWIMLLSPHAKEYAQRLIDAKEQIDIIRQDISDISKQLGSIAEKMKTPETTMVSETPIKQ